MAAAAPPPFSSELTSSLAVVRTVIGPEVPDPDLLRALAACNNNPEAAINHILDSPAPAAGVNVEPTGELGGGGEAKGGGFLVGGKLKEEVEVECEAERSSVTVARTSIAGVRVKAEPPCDFAGVRGGKGGSFGVEEKVKKEVAPVVKQESVVKEEVVDEPRSMVLYSGGGRGSGGCDVGSDGCFNPTPISCMMPPTITKDPIEERMTVVKENVEMEDEDFVEEEEWLLLGRTTVKGLSTCRGKGSWLTTRLCISSSRPLRLGASISTGSGVAGIRRSRCLKS